MEWQNRLLEELIYERLRLHVDLIDLIDFERDLCESIARAMRTTGTDPAERSALTRRYVDRAWRRLEIEWTRERAGEQLDCPRCDGGFAHAGAHDVGCARASPLE